MVLIYGETIFGEAPNPNLAGDLPSSPILLVDLRPHVKVQVDLNSELHRPDPGTAGVENNKR